MASAYVRAIERPAEFQVGGIAGQTVTRSEQARQLCPQTPAQFHDSASVFAVEYV